MPCSLADIYKGLKQTVALKVAAADSTETLVNIYQTTRIHIPEDANLHNHHV
jgi:hypothetical protein